MFKYIFSSDFNLFKALFGNKPQLGKKEQYYAEILKVLFFFPLSGIIFSFLNMGYFALLGLFGVKISTAPEPVVISNSLSLNIIMMLSYLITYYLCFYRTASNISEYKPLWHPKHKKKNVVICFIGFGFAMLGNIISGIVCSGLQYLSNLFDDSISKYIQNSISGGIVKNDFQSLDAYSLAILFITMVIFPPIIEELIFRQLFYGRLVRFSTATAVYLTTILFAFSHNNVQQIIFALFAGFGFMIVRMYTDNINLSISVHILVNLSAYCSQIIFGNQYLSFSLWFTVFMAILGLILFFIDKDYKELWCLHKFADERCELNSLKSQL